MLLCWRRTRQLRAVQMMGGVVLLAFYGLVSMTLGAYRNYDYMRIHTLFDPLVILLIWCTLLGGAVLLVQLTPDVRAWLAEHSFLGRRVT